MADTLRQRLDAEMKSALRAREKERLAAIRLIIAAVKQREVDERIELADGQVLEVMDKMLKQRRDSITQYRSAGRDDLAAKEEYEVGVIQAFMPAALSEAEIDALVNEAVTESGAASIKDMGKVMGVLKPKVQGRADMGAVGAKVRKALDVRS